jgi:hypothetical protein
MTPRQRALAGQMYGAGGPVQQSLAGLMGSPQAQMPLVDAQAGDVPFASLSALMGMPSFMDRLMAGDVPADELALMFSGITKGVGVGKGLFGKARSDTLQGSSGGRTPPPGGTPSGLPRPLLDYPPTVAPVLKVDRATGKEYLAKVNSPEAIAVKKQVDAAQRDIDTGRYDPMFDVAKRTDVDPTKYDLGAATLDTAIPKTAKSIAKYETMSGRQAGLDRLVEAYNAGKLIPGSENWYFMGQLERAFIKEFGAKTGRKMFREKFAKAMAATTGGASPRENLRTAMYGNYLRANNLPYPENAYAMPWPVGGRFISGNMRQHQRLMNEGNIDAARNPKRHNFEGDFLGDKAATLDEQMMGGFDRNLREPPGPSYGTFEARVGELAAQHGVDPRGFQDVTWAGLKKFKEGDRYPGAKPMIKEVNEMIERTARVTGLTPQQVLVEGLMKSRIPMYGVAGASLLGGATERF